jgi:hypothetical protein
LCNIRAVSTFYEELRVVEDICDAHDVCRVELLVSRRIQSFEANIAVILKIKLGISLLSRWRIR